MCVKCEVFARLKCNNKNGETFQNVDLSKYTTFHTGGKCKYLLKIATLEGFIKTILYIKSQNLPYFILGAGSNVLVSDKGYDGIIIILVGDLARMEMQGDILECGAGSRIAAVYAYARDRGLSGIEEGAGIPASIGGATYMNAQAYGFQMAQIVDYVVAYYDGRIKYFTNEECGFGYRKSIFMESGAIILRVGLKLSKLDKDIIQSKYTETISKRKQSQPLEYYSAGCVFKNIPGCITSKMLDDMGAKGMRVGGAMVSTKHANFIINYDHATSLDIFNLILQVKKQFLDTYGINLEMEIKLLGDFE